ncbi:MAG: TlpA disulfide reductase family protein [Bacteroidota bacterium]
MDFRYFTFLLILFLTAGCEQKTPNDFVILVGAISEEGIDSVYLQKKDLRQDFPKQAIAVSPSGQFKDTLYIPFGYYFLTFSNKTYELYLEPDFDLDLNLGLDAAEIQFEGKGKAENEYLLRKHKLRMETIAVDNHRFHANLTEKQFLINNDSIRSLYSKLLENSNLQNKRFEAIERKSILLDRVNNLMGFEIEKRLLTENKKFVISDSFPDPNALFDINDETLLNVPFYVPLLANNYYFFLKGNTELDTSSEILKCLDCDLFVEYLNHMGKRIENEKVRNATTFLLAKWVLAKTEDIDAFYKSYDSINTDKTNLASITRLYERLKSKKAKDFLFNIPLKDTDGNLLTLKEFKGKYIYLDVWSSSCAPCVAEFPHFNELFQALESPEIEFVGINILDTDERWMETVNTNQLLGIQLAVMENTKFLDSLGIAGMPRYILLDSRGEILDFNAQKPSELKLNGELQLLLEK